jgi:microcystin-dependent protein
MDSFLATIMLFAGNFAPQGWMFCDGTVLQIAQNTALFSLLGTTYGGDGRQNFALPKLQNPKSANDQDLHYIICVQGIYPSRS